jgi:histidine ammonia-lyase
MMITKVQSLAEGFSGVQLSTIERIIWHIENNVIPVVPEKGSVGASGDLAPLAHLFLPLIGLGECFYKGERKNTSEIFKKEASSLFNSAERRISSYQWNTIHFILCSKGSTRMHNCLEAADIIGAMSLEALTGTKAPFDERLHELRPLMEIN